MKTFLFWNVNRKPLNELIVTLAAEHSVDILILAELHEHPGALLQNLNERVGSEFRLPFSLCPSIIVLTRFSSEFIHPVSESDRLSIRRLKLPASEEILLAAVHFPSKLHWKESSQAFESAELARIIVEQEAAAGHTRTLLVGDLNMNPFEVGMAGAVGLHGVMTRHLASRRTRTIQGREYPFFYNPMWSRFGDRASGPAGTYYYDSAEHVNYFWNLFDQVLVRPSLLDRFSNDHLEILTMAGKIPLVRGDGRIDASAASDHLPVLFRLDL